MYTSCVLGVAFFGSLIHIALLPLKKKRLTTCYVMLSNPTPKASLETENSTLISKGHNHEG